MASPSCSISRRIPSKRVSKPTSRANTTRANTELELLSTLLQKRRTERCRFLSLVFGGFLSSQDQKKKVVAELIDSRNNMFVLTVKVKATSSAAPPRKLTFSSNEVDLKTAKGGIDPNKEIAEEEVGYYTVTGALGVGQCGMVRKGTHRTTGIEVAVKTLTKEMFVELGLVTLEFKLVCSIFSFAEVPPRLPFQRIGQEKSWS